MSSETPVRVLLGPQNPIRNIGAAVAAAELPEGPLAVISTGWQEAEGDLVELESVVGRPLEDLSLYARAESLFRDDDELAAAYRLRQDRLQKLQQLYRIRLRSLSVAARRLRRIDGDDDILQSERRHSVQQLRSLDAHHLEQGEAMHSEFDHVVQLESRDSVQTRSAEMRAILERCAGVIVTGGNVAVLINRLRLFGLGSSLVAQHLFAWSAGAMALTERIVLFHDRMPQGRREPEVFGRGLSIVQGLVTLPDATHRLRSGDRMRVELTARRFAPQVCITLNNGSAVRWEDGQPIDVEGARRLRRSGRLGPLRAA